MAVIVNLSVQRVAKQIDFKRRACVVTAFPVEINRKLEHVVSVARELNLPRLVFADWSSSTTEILKLAVLERITDSKPDINHPWNPLIINSRTFFFLCSVVEPVAFADQPVEFLVHFLA
jgi:hypothetical protein